MLVVSNPPYGTCRSVILSLSWCQLQILVAPLLVLCNLMAERLPDESGYFVYRLMMEQKNIARKVRLAYGWMYLVIVSFCYWSTKKEPQSRPEEPGDLQLAVAHSRIHKLVNIISVPLHHLPSPIQILSVVIHPTN